MLKLTRLFSKIQFKRFGAYKMSIIHKCYGVPKGHVYFFFQQHDTNNYLYQIKVILRPMFFVRISHNICVSCSMFNLHIGVIYIYIGTFKTCED